MKFAKCITLALALLVLPQLATTAKAQPEATTGTTGAAATTPAGTAAVKQPFSDLRAIGAGLVIFGAALGIGNLARAAVESMARQPEMAGNIQTAMIIAAALIEGVTFFALIIIIIQTG